MSSSHLFVFAAQRRAVAELQAIYDRFVRLVQEGARVTVFLVEDGVLSARRGPHAESLALATAAGVEVLADRRSLGDRGLRASKLVAGVRTTDLDALVNRVADGERATWL